MERLVLMSSGAVVAERLRRAVGARQRMKGLLGTTELPAREGLLIPRTRQVHTFGMRYPIDVVFLDGELQVVHLIAAMSPNRISRPMWRARSVVELPADAAAVLQVGDRLRLEPAG